MTTEKMRRVYIVGGLDILSKNKLSPKIFEINSFALTSQFFFIVGSSPANYYIILKTIIVLNLLIKKISPAL